MSCRSVRQGLAGYLDGAISGRDHGKIREHLEHCDACRDILTSYRRLEICLAQMSAVAPPPELALQIRIRAARAEAAASWSKQMWLRAKSFFEDIFEPFAVPATGGLVVAITVFALVVQGMLVGMPFGTVHDDLPTSLLQPARVESLAPFEFQGIANNGTGPEQLLLETTLDAHGQVVNYRILSGPDDPAVRRQLDEVLLFSRFRPELSFGRPTAGGHVMLSFSEIRVRG